MFEPGTQVGRYEIQRRLGRGGMGAVYVAHDPVLGRMVAIKVFSGDLDVADARERFTREARAAAALSHHNIVTIYDFGEIEAQPFIVMEYIAGETLASVIRRRTPVSIGDKLRWMEELCSGVGYAHQMHLVHRDIKPANLMIDRSGRLKILDFGIARMLAVASNTTLMIGTPGYMSPEQIGGGPVDYRADQFSIGVVFYELLAYKEAFPGDMLPLITHRILTEEPTPLAQLVPDTPPDVISIVEQALKKNAAERFPDCESLRGAIAKARRQYSSSAVWNTPTTAVQRDAGAPGTGGARGTGSSRRQRDEAVGVAQLTPPPDPRRTDREAIARRRTQQLEASLRQARELLARNELDAALDACQQALAFDETHLGALALEEEIEAALRERENAERAAAITVAPTPERSPGLGLLPAEAIERLAEAEAEAASVSPVAPGTMAEPAKLHPPVALPGAAIAARTRSTPAAAPAAPQPPAARATQARPPVPQPDGRRQVSIRAVMSALPRNRRTMAILGGVVILIAAVVAGIVLLSRPVAMGTLVLDAVPWATVTSIRKQGGDAVELPAAASTPLLMTLSTGTYEVVVTGPPPESQTRQVTVTIAADAPIVSPTIRFRAITPEEYFEQYLTAPVEAPVPASETASDAAGVTSPNAVPPAGAGR